MHGRCVQALWAAQVKAMEWRVRYLAETRPGAETHSVLVQNIPGIAFGTLPSRSKVRTTLTVDLHTYSRWQSCRTGHTCEAQHWLPLPIPDALRPPCWRLFGMAYPPPGLCRAACDLPRCVHARQEVLYHTLSCHAAVTMLCCLAQ